MIILALGSNLPSTNGDRFYNIDLAVSYLEHYGIQILKKSSYYETDSFPNKKDPKFINIVISAKTVLSPEDLASVLIFIEEKLERKRSKKNEPRTCDIDIIDFKGEIIKNDDLEAPHPRLHLRNFVIYPLKEIEPNWLHPVFNKKIDSFFLKLDKNSHKEITRLSKHDMLHL